MAAPSRTSNLDVAESAVTSRLREEPYCIGFFQAVRLLRLAARRLAPGYPSSDSLVDVVRFGAHASLAFPAAQIQSLTCREGKPPLMTVNLMGLIGPLGILPLPYTELVIDRIYAGDKAMRDFFDMFHDRVIALFYEAWQKYRCFVAHEQGNRSHVYRHLLDLLGLGTAGLQNRTGVPYNALIGYAGLLAQKPRSATALQHMLEDYFEVPVEIEQFTGRWRSLDPGAQSWLQDGETPAEQLGLGSVVGDEVWDLQFGVRIKLGPLTLRQYLEFLPTGTAYEPLRSLVRFFSNDEMDFEVQLLLRGDQVPRCRLDVEPEPAPRLGWITWMETAQPRCDVADAVLPL